MTAAATPTKDRRPLAALALRPGRDETADAVMLVVLTVIGIVGFRTAYGGHGYLVVGTAGAILGVLLSHIGHRARLPLLSITALGVLLFLLLGGVVGRSGIGSDIPTLATMHEVVSAAIGGWKQLLTTARPVGSTAHLLVLPYLLGIASGIAGHALARRTSRLLLPAAAPAGVVALGILFGADHATAAVLQGAAFTGLALAWAGLRQQRDAVQLTTVGRHRPWYRIGTAVAVLVIAVAGATIIAPLLPGADAHPRVVLHVVPPFDVNAYPSPLAGFRDYTKDASPSVSVHARRLLTTTGLPSGDLVRIATMDTYNGLVWAVANTAAGTSSFAGFQRIGATVPGVRARQVIRATITIDTAYQLPWLPDLPGTAAFAFTGPGGHAVQNALRFNVATTTGIVPGGLPAGTRYVVAATKVAEPTAAQLSHATPYGTPDDTSAIPPAVQAFADAHAGQAVSPVARVLALAAFLRVDGRYSNGGAGQTEILAGHSAGRITSFLQAPQVIGDDEQYAAAMALLAEAVGVPARVALDGTVEAGGDVYGRDIRADIELHLAQYGWITLPASQFVGARKATPQPLTTPPPAPAKVVPPPPGNAAPIATDNEGNAVSRKAPNQPGHDGFRLPAIVLALLRDAGLPLLAATALAGGFAGAKALRRRRRRTRGAPAARVTGAWREILDAGRDIGIAPDSYATRREQAANAELRGLPQVAALAQEVDAAVFGLPDPDDAAADRIWTLTDQTRRGATAGLTRWRRIWVAVNPASLLANLARPAGPAAGGARP
jgi:hypothetical protein